MPLPLSFSDVQQAADRLHGLVRRTPIMHSASLDDATGSRLFFKCENFQRTGAFKFRDANNALLQLEAADRARGVATHSSGNHGAALALAARLHGVPVWVVMPRGANVAKRAAVAAYGARIVDCEPTMSGRELALAAVVEAQGLQVIHPYNDLRVMAGQGTAALELLADEPDLDVLLTPVGGGGLLSGSIVAARGITPAIRVYGAEPAGADDAARALATGRIEALAQPDTLADGLRATLGELPFTVLREQVTGIVTVDDAAIVRAMRLVWERLKIIIEPSAAVPVAALLEGKVPLVAGQRVGVILSGGNVDLDALPW